LSPISKIIELAVLARTAGRIVHPDRLYMSNDDQSPDQDKGHGLAGSAGIAVRMHQQRLHRSQRASPSNGAEDVRLAACSEKNCGRKAHFDSLGSTMPRW
jgi:hypothetical protein